MGLVEISLHNHTVLSPCAELEMTPAKIMARAAAEGIEIVGITDHNSAANLRAAEYQAERFGIRLLPGVEITTSEDIHLLGFFAEAGAADWWLLSLIRNYLKGNIILRGLVTR